HAGRFPCARAGDASVVYTQTIIISCPNLGDHFTYLDKPTDALKPLTIPLQPMLGCVGVAPPGLDVIRTGDSGIFGGNMDYNQLREGTTIYLPVFQEGALLFMGDGHAAQGDGEL